MLWEAGIARGTIACRFIVGGACGSAGEQEGGFVPFDGWFSITATTLTWVGESVATSITGSRGPRFPARQRDDSTQN